MVLVNNKINGNSKSSAYQIEINELYDKNKKIEEELLSGEVWFFLVKKQDSKVLDELYNMSTNSIPKLTNKNANQVIFSYLKKLVKTTINGCYTV